MGGMALRLCKGHPHESGGPAVELPAPACQASHSVVLASLPYMALVSACTRPEQLPRAEASALGRQCSLSMGLLCQGLSLGLIACREQSGTQGVTAARPAIWGVLVS